MIWTSIKIRLKISKRWMHRDARVLFYPVFSIVYY